MPELKTPEQLIREASERDQRRIPTWCGRPMEDLPREELLNVIEHLVREREEQMFVTESMLHGKFYMKET